MSDIELAGPGTSGPSVSVEEEPLSDTTAELHVESHGDPPQWFDKLLSWIFRIERTN